MKIQFLTFLTLLALVSSCSSNKSVDDEVDAQEESVGLEDENNYESDENVNEEEYSQDTIEQKDDEPAMADSSAEAPAPSTVQLSGEEMLYTVEKGDTLMLIAFKLYGQYSKWKSIQNLNPELSSFESLQAGTQIKVIQPTEEFVWRPEGNPYLIKRNDTLRKISYGIYDTENNWDHLYEHNNKLIKDPDVIFAGFTIYYLNAEQLNRDPANSAAAPQAVAPAQEEVAEESQPAEPYQESNPVEEMAPDQEAAEEVAQNDSAEEEVSETIDTEMSDEEPEAEEFEE